MAETKEKQAKESKESKEHKLKQQKEEELLKITIQGSNRAYLSGGSKALKELDND